MLLVDGWLVVDNDGWPICDDPTWCGAGKSDCSHLPGSFPLPIFGQCIDTEGRVIGQPNGKDMIPGWTWLNVKNWLHH